MKKIFLSICLSLIFYVGASAQGIVFEKGTVSEVIAKAIAQNKLIFVDVYTDWCGPCKVMSANVFTSEKVGELFNRNFINYKVDAEKGDGPKFAQKYEISAYPTMLFINPADSSVVHKIIGARDEEKLLNEANMIERSAKYGGLEKMRQDFEAGENDLDFLLSFYKLMSEKDNLRGALALRCLKNIPDDLLCDQKNDYYMTLIGRMVNDINVFDKDFFYRFVDVLAAFKESGGKLTLDYNSTVTFEVSQKAGALVERAINRGDEQTLEELLRYKEYWPAGLTRNIDHDIELMYGRGLFFASSDFLRLEFYRVNDKEEKFIALFPRYMEHIMTDYPKGEFKSDFFDIEKTIELAKEHEGVMMIMAEQIHNNASRSIDSFIRYIEYYWQNSPNDNTIKSQVAKWLDYIVSLNPYYTAGIKNMMPLFMRIGCKKEALLIIDDTLAKLENFTGKGTRRYHSISNLKKIVTNDKI